MDDLHMDNRGLCIWVQNRYPSGTSNIVPDEITRFPVVAREPLQVRPTMSIINTVKVRVGESNISLAEGNCVTRRWGRQQLEANDRSAGFQAAKQHSTPENLATAFVHNK
jgi:hypothetical protein